jgi:chromate transporter
MNLLLLYLLMLKATMLSMNGQSSLPIVRDEFVVKRHVLTDRQLSAAVTVAQSAPGPMGGYGVSVGYFIAGVPGACMTWLALITPAFFVIPLMRYAGRHVDNPGVRRSLDGVVIAGSALVIQTAMPLAFEAGVTRSVVPAAVAAGAFAAVAFTRIPTVFVILAGAVIGVLL